jgi:hypothetical protein
VVLLVGRGVLVDLDEHHLGVVEMGLDPVGVDEDALSGTRGHAGPPGMVMRGKGHGRCWCVVTATGPTRRCAPVRCGRVSDADEAPGGRARRSGVSGSPGSAAPSGHATEAGGHAAQVHRESTCQLCHGHATSVRPERKRLTSGVQMAGRASRKPAISAGRGR